MKFIGIDLGWQSGASGLCCLDWQNNYLEISDLTTELEIESILNWIDRLVPKTESAIIAVDAPTLIPNQTGMRLPDRLTHKYFGRYHAGCYPANLNRPFARRTVNFGLSLEQRGFRHAPKIEPQQSGRYQIEVFPHIATINLFNLDRILKYKKGKLQRIVQEKPIFQDIRNSGLSRMKKELKNKQKMHKKEHHHFSIKS